MPHHANQVRLLGLDDVPLVERLLRTSEYIYQRFTLDELPVLLKHYPAVGMFSGSSLQGFLLTQNINPPVAWIAGFGVSWTESRAYLNILHKLLEALTGHLFARRVQYLYYSGNDAERDWLRSALLVRGFVPYRLLYAYDKFEYAIPSQGNQHVIIRPIQLNKGGTDDMPALLRIEEACFDDLWRYDELGFSAIAATHPYFVVAELNGTVVGYQFNALDSEFGYLVRIAVHPSTGSKGIGIRLMAEAIHFFKHANVSRIMLNTQEDNLHAHRLYEWFGFIRIHQTGFVLRKLL